MSNNTADEASSCATTATKTQNLQTQLVNIFAPDESNLIQNGSIASNFQQKMESQTSINKNFLLNKVN